MNPVGCEILGGSPAELRGQASFLPADALAAVVHEVHAGGAGSTGHTTLARPGGWADRDVEYRYLHLSSTGPARRALAFRDITESRLRERQLAAFGRAAESVAFGGSLRSTLDMICDEIVSSTGLAAGQILLIDGTDLRLQVHGAAPAAAFPPDFAIRLDEARQRGAELKSLVTLQTKQPVVVPHRKAEMLANPRWEPLHEHFNRPSTCSWSRASARHSGSTPLSRPGPRATS